MMENERDHKPEPAMDPAEFGRLMSDPGTNVASEPRALRPATPNLRHGLYSRRLEAMQCDDRCPFAELCEYAGQESECVLESEWLGWRKPLVARVVRDDGGDTVLLDTLILIYVHAEIRYRRGFALMQLEGEMRREPKTGLLEDTPVSQRLSRLANEVSRRLDDLGLSPMARAKLERDRHGGGAMALLGLVQQSEPQQQEGEVFEAEFEAEGGLTPGPSPSQEDGARERGDHDGEC